MLQDETNGYLLAMGELTGTTMFVGSVVLGFIVRLGAPNDQHTQTGESRNTSGVPCKGPLLRDVSVLFLITLVTNSYFERGVIDYVFVHTMLGIYVAYVMIVLWADAYHMFYHLPQIQRNDCENHDAAKDANNGQIISEEYGKGSYKQYASTDRGIAIQPVTLDETAEDIVDECTPLAEYLSSRSDDSSIPKHRHSLGNALIEAISNYSLDEELNTLCDGSNECSKEDRPEIASSKTFLSTKNYSTGWGPKSINGTEAVVTFHPHHAIHPHHSNRNSVIFRQTSITSDEINRKMSHEKSCKRIDEHQSLFVFQQNDTDNYNAIISCDQNYVSENILSTPSSWAEAWHRNVREWNEHWSDFFNDIYHNPENNSLDIILLSIELPFTILRKASMRLLLFYIAFVS